jgi:hypothetical protein
MYINYLKYIVFTITLVGKKTPEKHWKKHPEKTIESGVSGVVNVQYFVTNYNPTQS